MRKCLQSVFGGGTCNRWSLVKQRLIQCVGGRHIWFHRCDMRLPDGALPLLWVRRFMWTKKTNTEQVWQTESGYLLSHTSTLGFHFSLHKATWKKLLCNPVLHEFSQYFKWTEQFYVYLKPHLNHDLRDVDPPFQSRLNYQNIININIINKTALRWISMNAGADTHKIPKWEKPPYFGDPLTFTLTALWDWHFSFLVKCLKKYETDCHEICYRPSGSPQDEF